MLPNAVSSRLDALHKKRLECVKANAADRAMEFAEQKEKSRLAREKSHIESKEDEDDRMHWTAQRWELYEKSRTRAGSRSGYKGHFDLAHSTYLKEIGRIQVDKEKYKQNTGDATLQFQVRSSKEDIDGLARSLQEASERRFKKRRTGDGGDFITEKNRQFNMKLDREFGQDS